MAQRGVAEFKTVKDARYNDNTTGEVSASDSRDMFEDTADSFVTWEDGVLDEDDMASDSASHVPTQSSVKAYVDANGVSEPEASSGTSIAFDKVRTYGYSAAETGNITLDATGFKEGITQLIIHNHSSIPTYGAEFYVINGEYSPNEDNYIFCHSVKSNLILVTISQVL